MIPIPGRWHDSGILDLNSGAPAVRAALAFALYGLRLRAEGISPGPASRSGGGTGPTPRPVPWSGSTPPARARSS